MKRMYYGYANGNCRQATSTQVEAIQAFRPGLRVAVEEKGSDDEWRFLVAADGKPKALGRGSGHFVVVANFHQLATNTEDLVARVNAVHSRGSYILEPGLEGKPHRSSEDRVALVDMVIEALDFYRKGISKRDRSRAGAIGAKHSPVAKPKEGRMPVQEAAPILKDEQYGRKQALDEVNKLSRKRGYKVPWTDSYLQGRVNAKEIVLPVRKSGPKRT